MKTSQLFMLLIIIVVLGSCEQNKEIKYYTSGKVKEERIYRKSKDTSMYFETYYYINGSIKSEGHICKNEKNGLWKEWYSDGSIKWDGLYNDNIREYEIPLTSPNIILKDSILELNVPSNLRVDGHGIHPDDFIIYCKNGIIKNADNKDLFDFTIIPERKGFIKFAFFVMKDGKMNKVGYDSLLVAD
jgi:hypothetical protein